MTSTIPYERHVFVCTNERPPGHPRGCCAAKGSVEIRERLKALVKSRGLAGRVRVNAAGCLDFCETGVSIVVYPENVWYGHVALGDLEEIVDRHLLRGEPVTRLLLPAEVLRKKGG
jgi:(2Fe-2S) ferredoxin